MEVNGNLIKRIRQSHDIHEAFPRDSRDQQERDLIITGISPDIGLMVCHSPFSCPSTILGQTHINTAKLRVPV